MISNVAVAGVPSVAVQRQSDGFIGLGHGIPSALTVRAINPHE